MLRSMASPWGLDNMAFWTNLVNSPDLVTIKIHGFGPWEEDGIPGQNLRRYWANIRTPHRKAAAGI